LRMNTCSLLLMKKLVARWLMESRTLKGLAAEITHTDFLTNRFLVNEVAVAELLLIPLFKNAAQIMLPGSLVK